MGLPCLCALFMLADLNYNPTRAVQSYKKYALKLTFRVSRYPDETLGQKIKKLRLEKSLKQTDLAKVLGVNKDTIWNREKGKTVPGERYLRRLEGIFEKNFL